MIINKASIKPQEGRYIYALCDMHLHGIKTLSIVKLKYYKMLNKNMREGFYCENMQGGPDYLEYVDDKYILAWVYESDLNLLINGLRND